MSQEPTPAAAPAPYQDCLACRLTGAATFTGIGVYALEVARRDGAYRRVKPPGASLIGGRVTAALGVGE